MERTHIESSKTTAGNADTLGMSNRPTIPATSAQSDFCKFCGRLSPEAETNNAKLLKEQELLLNEINATKEEVLAKTKNLQERGEKGKKEKGESNEAGTLFNVKNLGSLQDLLDQAEETEEMLLFVDKKQNVWQIVKRNDINIGESGDDSQGNEGNVF